MQESVGSGLDCVSTFLLLLHANTNRQLHPCFCYIYFAAAVICYKIIATAASEFYVTSWSRNYDRKAVRSTELIRNSRPLSLHLDSEQLEQWQDVNHSQSQDNLNDSVSTANHLFSAQP